MSKTVRIRMYNVGFGDCFLITLPDGKTILVDAGFHSQGKGKFGGNDLAEQIIQDVTVDEVARIDVVIATHRHQDHVYAFNSKAWEQVEVGEVWLPWVEDRTNAKARKLWDKQNRFAMSLAAALPTFQLSEEQRASVDFMLWNAGVELHAGLAAAAGGWSNKGALDCLHDGFAHRDRQRPRFLPSTQKFPESFETAVLPGVVVHVLGPSRDPDNIQELDPEDDGETYRALALRGVASGNAPDALQLAAPFGEEWQVPDEEDVGSVLDATELERLGALSESADALAAAQKLDNIINSTSLVLVLEIGKARLLLPGDAEWGTWSLILGNEDATQLLKGCTFFKVGHHGSHNATSPTLVETVLPRNIPALISTQKGDGNYRNNIPLKDLIDALKDRGMQCVRSDKPGADLPANFEKGPQGKWIDVTIRC